MSSLLLLFLFVVLQSLDREIYTTGMYIKSIHFRKMWSYLRILKVSFFHIIHQLLIERHSLKHQSIFYPEMHGTKMNKTENQESTYSLKINY